MRIRRDKSHIYGELTAPSIAKLAKHMHKHKKKSFLDIGSGYGLVTRGVDEYFRELDIDHFFYFTLFNLRKEFIDFLLLSF